MEAWFTEFLKVLSSPWAVLGLFGQALFFTRWIVQWVASERRKKSYVPLQFWIISLLGGLSVLVYAIHRHDAVFIMGQLVGIANYARNIVLMMKAD